MAEPAEVESRRRRPWCKLWREQIADRRVRRLPDAAFRAWVILHLLPDDLDGRLVTDGVVLELADVADELGRTESEAAVCLRALEDAHLLVRDAGGWSLPNYRRAQESASAARMRRHRATRADAVATENTEERRERREERGGSDAERDVTPSVTPSVTVTHKKPRARKSKVLVAPLQGCLELASVWNEETAGSGLPAVALAVLGSSTENAAARRRKALARLSEHPNLDEWRLVVRRIKARPWCRGANPSGWRASFDYLIEVKTFDDYMTGKFAGIAVGEERLDSFGWDRTEESGIREGGVDVTDVASAGA